MNLRKTVIINEQIMELIQSKYPGLPPGCFSDPDYKYFAQLEHDTELARQTLGGEVLTAEETEQLDNVS